MSLALQVEVHINAEQDEMKCIVEISKAESPHFSLWIVELPTFPGRICIVNIEFITEDRGHILFGGNTKPFHDGFVDAKIPVLGYVRSMLSPTSSRVSYSNYQRRWKDLNFSDESVLEKRVEIQSCRH